MVAFSAGTPFQIINCINIKRNVLGNAPADLFCHTIGGYAKMHDVTLRVRELGIFENVYEYRLMENDFLTEKLAEGLMGFEKNKIISLINSANVDGVFDLTKKEYTDFYAASGLPFNSLLGFYFGRRNKNFKIFFYDEGIGQYTSKYALHSDRDGIFSGILGVDKIQKCRSLLPEFAGRYLYEPRLISFQNFNKLNQLPKIDLADRELVDIYNKIFDYQPDENLSSRKYIYFNSGFFAEGRLQEELEISEILLRTIPKDDLVIKFHPSVKAVPSEYEKYNFMEIKPVPFELFVMNDKTFSSKILITPYSSAVLTPKLVFGMEAEFVVLDGACTRNKMGIFNKVKMIYEDRNKAHLLNGAEEFASEFPKIVRNQS
ncbi:MAG: hypothetical protein LBB04_03435 [Oscillospiraceae bacterium]|jgi:hypothetical protein|nr:hypothetical protein [Oscillospiraceae bacterium]